jgi:hypothetical protein
MNMRVSPVTEVGQKVSITPHEWRKKVIAKIGGRDQAPRGFETMTRAELRRTFGATTIGRYLSDSRRRKAKTYRQDAGALLSMIVDMMKVIENIDRSLPHLESVVKDTQGPIANYIAELRRQRQLFEDGDIVAMRASVNKTKAAGQGMAKNLPAGIKPNFNITQNHLNALDFKILATADEATQNLARDIISVLVRHRTGDETPEHHRLACIKDFAVLGIFSEYDLLRFLMGGDEFAKKMQREFEAIDKKQRAQNFRGNAFYESFKRNQRSFIQETFGLALFAFPEKRPVEQWGSEQVAALSQFAENRYKLVYHVILGLADSHHNPLGGTIRPDQTPLLLSSILRAALYPNYKIEMRVGYGGTDKNGALVRSAGYVMNALDIMAIFQTANDEVGGDRGINSPTLQVVSAHELSVAVNDLDHAMTSENSGHMLRYIKHFVEKFYPSLAPAVMFSQPSREEVFRSDIHDVVVSATRAVASAASAKVTEVSGAWDTVASFATRHCMANEAAMNAASAYVAGHLSPSVFATVGSREKPSGAVWKIGGGTEMSFDILQGAIRDALFHSSEAAGLSFPDCIFTTTTNGGRPPPYYRDDKCPVDITVREAWAFGGEQERNFLACLAYTKTGAASDLRSMLSHPRLGRGQLAAGWEQLREVLTGSMTAEIVDPREAEQPSGAADTSAVKTFSPQPV